MLLREQLTTLTRAATAAQESPGRAQARRLLRAIATGGGEGVWDHEYGWLIDHYRLRDRIGFPDP